MMFKICLFIYKLDLGGAQRQVVELSKSFSEAGYDVTLMSCYDGGVFSEDVKSDTKIKYISLNKKGRWDVFGFFIRFLLSIRRLRPDVLYGFLSFANLISVFAKILLPGVKVVFGVRASNIDLKKYGISMRIAFQLECFFSRFADVVIANSVAGKIDYQKVFSFPNEIRVVPNGINTEIFKPDPDKRAKQRTAWNMSDKDILIGIAARMDSMKGYPVFIKAAAIAVQKHQEVFFVCVGDGPEGYAMELKALAKELGVSDRIIWTGFNHDMSQVYNSLDLFTSASLFGEGFSNTVGEAMATGIPCVVTDVGDSALIVGDTGIVVFPNDPVSLVSGWEEFLSGNKNISSQKIRKKIVDEFDLRKLIKRTEKILLYD